MTGSNGSATPAKAAGQTLAINQQSLTDIVGSKMDQWLKEGAIVLPKDYSVDNAMKFAWLELQTVQNKDYKNIFVDGVLQESICSKNSVVAALLNMAVQGLNVGKDQGYFIVYGGQLSFQRSYFGTETVTMMVQPLIGDFASEIVYEGDVFEYTIDLGQKTITTHQQKFGNMKNDKILGAYAIALNAQGQMWKTEVMTIQEIHESWKKSKQNPFDSSGRLKADSNHAKHPVEFCKRTVLNRLCKPIINTSTDKQLLLNMIKTSDELADRAMVEEDIEHNANKGDVIDITKGQEQTALAGQAETITQETKTGEEQPAEKPIDAYRKRLHQAFDFVTLNNINKEFMGSTDLTPEEKNDLKVCYQAEGKRLSQPAKQEQETAQQEPLAEEQRAAAGGGAPF